MVAWIHIIVDTVNYMISAVSGEVKKGDKGKTKEIKQTASKLGINLPDPDVFSNRTEQPTSSTPQNSAPHSSTNPNASSSPKEEQRESINIEGMDGRNLETLKNPYVIKALASSESDFKFQQYEHMGLLDLCIRQRKERLAQQDDKKE